MSIKEEIEKIKKKFAGQSIYALQGRVAVLLNEEDIEPYYWYGWDIGTPESLLIDPDDWKDIIVLSKELVPPEKDTRIIEMLW